MAYSTCEESYIERKEEAWNNPEALKDYRRYLKERYGDIAKLNAVWNAKFKSFDEIAPISFAEAKTSRQPTRWMEQELHKVDRFNQVQEVVNKTIQGLGPRRRGLARLHGRNGFRLAADGQRHPRGHPVSAGILQQNQGKPLRDLVRQLCLHAG